MRLPIVGVRKSVPSRYVERKNRLTASGAIKNMLRIIINNNYYPQREVCPGWVA